MELAQHLVRQGPEQLRAEQDELPEILALSFDERLAPLVDAELLARDNARLAKIDVLVLDELALAGPSRRKTKNDVTAED